MPASERDSSPCCHTAHSTTWKQIQYMDALKAVSSHYRGFARRKPRRTHSLTINNSSHRLWLHKCISNNVPVSKAA
jgi:hypothetical protein